MPPRPNTRPASRRVRLAANEAIRRLRRERESGRRMVTICGQPPRRASFSRSMARVLVTDGTARSALAVVRSLGRRGHHVFVVAERLPALAAASRFAAGSAAIPDVRVASLEAIEAIESRSRSWSIDFLIPMTDATLTGLYLSGAGSRLGPAIVLAPEREAFDAIADKGALLKRAEALTIGVPRSRVVESPDDLSAAASDIGFPCVLKPARSVISLNGRLSSFPVRYADAPASVPAYPVAAFPLLVQERVVGSGEGVFMLTQHGHVVATFAHRRLREKPPSGGVSTYRESIEPPKDLVGWSKALVADLRWNGVAMIEFKRRAETGVAALMEVNGRFWGSLQLAIDAGVDFPAMLIDQACGVPFDPPANYRVPVRSRWEWGDVDQLLACLRGGTGSGPRHRGRLGSIAEFLRIRVGDRLEVLKLNDLAPFFRESIDWFQGR